MGVMPPGCPPGGSGGAGGSGSSGASETPPARHCRGMDTSEGLVEARRAVLLAHRDVEAWQALWMQTRAWAQYAPAVGAALKASRNVLDGLLTAMMEAQVDADNDDADARTEGTDDP